MGRLDMHTIQEFVRLARMGTGFRAVARMLRISPNTEREYRKVLEAEGLLVGDPNDLPELAVLQTALEKRRPARLAPQQRVFQPCLRGVRADEGGDDLRPPGQRGQLSSAPCTRPRRTVWRGDFSYNEPAADMRGG